MNATYTVNAHQEWPRVLVVDDDPDSRAELADITRLDRLKAVPSGNALEALEALDKFATDPEINFAVIDVGLPDADGLSLAREMLEQADLDGRAMKFLIITGGAGAGAEETAKALGAIRYLHKPIEPDDLLEAIRATIGGGPAEAAGHGTCGVGIGEAMSSWRIFWQAANERLKSVEERGCVVYFSADEAIRNSAGDMARALGVLDDLCTAVSVNRIRDSAISLRIGAPDGHALAVVNAFALVRDPGLIRRIRSNWFAPELVAGGGREYAWMMTESSNICAQYMVVRAAGPTQ